MKKRAIEVKVVYEPNFPVYWRELASCTESVCVSVDAIELAGVYHASFADIGSTDHVFTRIITKTGRDLVLIGGPSFEEIAALMRDPS